MSKVDRVEFKRLAQDIDNSKALADYFQITQISVNRIRRDLGIYSTRQRPVLNPAVIADNDKIAMATMVLSGYQVEPITLGHEPFIRITTDSIKNPNFKQFMDGEFKDFGSQNHNSDSPGYRLRPEDFEFLLHPLDTLTEDALKNKSAEAVTVYVLAHLRETPRNRLAFAMKRADPRDVVRANDLLFFINEQYEKFGFHLDREGRSLPLGIPGIRNDTGSAYIENMLETADQVRRRMFRQPGVYNLRAYRGVQMPVQIKPGEESDSGNWMLDEYINMKAAEERLGLDARRFLRKNQGSY